MSAVHGITCISKRDLLCRAPNGEGGGGSGGDGGGQGRAWCGGDPSGVDCVERFDGVGDPRPWEPPAGRDRQGGCPANDVARAMSPNLGLRTTIEGHCIYVGGSSASNVLGRLHARPGDLHGGNKGSTEGGCTPLPRGLCVGHWNSDRQCPRGPADEAPVVGLGVSPCARSSCVWQVATVARLKSAGEAAAHGWHPPWNPARRWATNGERPPWNLTQRRPGTATGSVFQRGLALGATWSGARSLHRGFPFAPDDVGERRRHRGHIRNSSPAAHWFAEAGENGRCRRQAGGGGAQRVGRGSALPL
jgi:hypothetical protein